MREGSKETNTSNTATAQGGGIINESGAGSLNVTNSTISGNTAGAGGAVQLLNGATLNLTNSTISGNSAKNDGGGLRVTTGLLTISNSTVAYNHADDDNNGFGSGAGIFRNTGTVTLSNTIVGHDFKGGVLQVETATVAGTITGAGNAKVVVTAAGMPNSPKKDRERCGHECRYRFSGGRKDAHGVGC